MRLMFDKTASFMAHLIYRCCWVIIASSKRLAVFFWVHIAHRSGYRRLLVMALLFGLGLSYYPAAVSPWVFPQYHYMHERFSGLLIFDAKDRLIGMMPGAMDSAGDFADSFPSEDHKSAYIAVDEIPQNWWKILRTLEDRHLGSWRSWGGVDVVALLEAIVSDLPRGRFRGASTLPMMLVRNMRHSPASPAESWWDKMTRKLREWLHAPVLMYNLGRGDMRRLQQWLAMHVALAQGAPGSPLGTPVYGLKAASYLLFKKHPLQLDLAEQAVLAAAFKRPVLLVSKSQPNSRGIGHRNRRWERILQRASYGIRQTFPDSKLTHSALEKLSRLPPPVPNLDPALQSLLPESPQYRFRVRGNLASRAYYFAYPEMLQLSAELQDGYGRFWRKNTAEVRISIDIAENFRFKRSVRTTLEKMQLKHKGHLQLSLLLGNNKDAAQVVVAAANAKGALIRYYASGDDSVYSGIASRRDRSGRYTPGAEVRPIGSLGKIAIALFLGGEKDTPNTMYCNRRLSSGQRAIRNPNGDTGVEDCRAPHALYPAWQTFARSLNLPLLHRLRAIPDARLEPLVSAFELQRPRRDAALSVGLTLGTLAASPRTLHNMVHRLLRGFTGIAGRSRVSIIDRLRNRSGNGQLVWHMTQRRQGLPTLLQHYFGQSEVRSYAQAVLSAPLMPGGTAQRLSDWRETINPSVALHFAKTGTTPAANHLTRDAYLTGGLLLNGKGFSYFTLVGTHTPSRPLADRFGGGDNAPLVRTTLKSLLP